jgi:putative membrane protein
MELIKLVGVGVILGITTVIPGVSAGTMTVVLNVYDRLLAVITPKVKTILASWKFWLPLVAGGVLGIVFFSKVASLLLSHYPVPTYWFFIGIIAGSIPLVYRRVRQPDSALPALPSIICGILALGIIIVLVIVRPSENTALYTAITPQLFAMLVVGGALAAVAMIIPGISGSFLLLVIGLYHTIVQAVSDFNISLIVPLALGAIFGILVGAAFVRFLMAKVPRQTYGAILGLVVGSIVVLFPGGLGNGATAIFSIISMILGAAISLILGRQKKQEENHAAHAE